MIRKYEACFLLRADLSDEDVEKEIQFIESLIVKNEGKIVNKELWGRKNLAYLIQKRKEALYCIFYFEVSSSSIKSMKESFNKREQILRYLILSRKTLPQKQEEENGESKPE